MEHQAPIEQHQTTSTERPHTPVSILPPIGHPYNLADGAPDAKDAPYLTTVVVTCHPPKDVKRVEVDDVGDVGEEDSEGYCKVDMTQCTNGDDDEKVNKVEEVEDEDEDEDEEDEVDEVDDDETDSDYIPSDEEVDGDDGGEDEDDGDGEGEDDDDDDGEEDGKHNAKRKNRKAEVPTKRPRLFKILDI